MLERFISFLKDLAIPADYDGNAELFKMYRLVKPSEIDTNTFRANFDASNDDEILTSFLRGEIDGHALEKK